MNSIAQHSTVGLENLKTLAVFKVSRPPPFEFKPFPVGPRQRKMGVLPSPPIYLIKFLPLLNRKHKR